MPSSFRAAVIVSTVLLSILVLASCGSGEEVGLGDARGTTTAIGRTTTPESVPAVAGPTTTVATSDPARGGRQPNGAEEEAAVDAVHRWIELEDRAFAAGTTAAVRTELDELVSSGTDVVDLALDAIGPLQRTSRARIERIWHPEPGVVRMDVCKMTVVDGREHRATHTVTATAGATPFLRSTLVEDLERDGSACPPDEIIEPVLATYRRWMELDAAAAADPTTDITELLDLSGPEQADRLVAYAEEQIREGFYLVPHENAFVELMEHDPHSNEIVAKSCRVEDPTGGVFDVESGDRVSPAIPRDPALYSVRLKLLDGTWRVVSSWYPEDVTWCTERL